MDREQIKRLFEMEEHVRRDGYGINEQKEINESEKKTTRWFSSMVRMRRIKAVRYSVLQTDKEGRFR